MERQHFFMWPCQFVVSTLAACLVKTESGLKYSLFLDRKAKCQLSNVKSTTEPEPHNVYFLILVFMVICEKHKLNP